MTSILVGTERSELLALAYIAFARRFSVLESWSDERESARLVRCLAEAGCIESSALAGEATALGGRHRTDLERDFNRIFHRSMPPPYETTYTSRGSTADLADIAGFYRAFGVHIERDKPDHLVAELEYLAYVTMREVHARQEGDQAHVEILSRARASFLRDHIGCWLDAFADRIEQSSGKSACALMVRAAAKAVAADARAIGIAPSVVKTAAEPPPFPGPEVDADTPPCADGSEES